MQIPHPGVTHKYGLSIYSCNMVLLCSLHALTCPQTPKPDGEIPCIFKRLPIAWPLARGRGLPSRCPQGALSQASSSSLRVFSPRRPFGVPPAPHVCPMPATGLPGKEALSISAIFSITPGAAPKHRETKSGGEERRGKVSP